MGLNERNLCKFECLPLFTFEFKSVDAFSIGIQISVEPIYAPILCSQAWPAAFLFKG